MRILGIDPSLSNFGIVTGTLNHSHDFVPDDMTLVESKPDNKNKKVVRKNSDDLHRAQTLTNGLKPYVEQADIVMVEVPVGSQSARSMASYGICIGILSGIEKPMIQVTPTEVKLIATNSKTASKSDMIDWASNLHPQLPWLTRTVKGQTTLVAKNEHLADALAVVYAGMNTDLFQQLLAFRKVS